MLCAPPLEHPCGSDFSSGLLPDVCLFFFFTFLFFFWISNVMGRYVMVSLLIRHML